MRWGVYATRDFATRYRGEVLGAAPFIGFTENFGPARVRRWLDRHVDQPATICRLNGLLAMAEAAALGIGATVLPCFVGAERADLVRVGPPVGDLDVELWMLTHPDLRHAARVRAFTEFAGVELGRQRRLFEGETGESY